MTFVNNEIIEKVKDANSKGQPAGIIGWNYCHDEDNKPSNFSDRVQIAQDIIKGKYDYMVR